MAKTRFRDIKKSNSKNKKENNIEIENNNFASIGDRFKAFMTDIFMLLMPIMYFVVYIVVGSREGFRDNMAMGWLYIIIPNFILVVIFFAKKSQTPGCKAYNIKLVDRDGNKPLIGAIILRYYIELLSLITIIPLFMPFFHKDKKSLQDVISATYLMKVEN